METRQQEIEACCLAGLTLLAAMSAGQAKESTKPEWTAVMPGLQDPIIQFHVNLLHHTNELTGLRYADDPALLATELQNEEDFFLTMTGYEDLLKNAPTYRKAELWPLRRVAEDALREPGSLGQGVGR